MEYIHVCHITMQVSSYINETNEAHRIAKAIQTYPDGTSLLSLPFCHPGTVHCGPYRMKC